MVYGDNGLKIINISNATNPIEVGEFNPDYLDARDIFVSGLYAYIIDTNDGLIIVSISDLSNPVEVSRFREENENFAGKSLWVSRSLAYIMDRLNGLYIIDISDPATPKQVGFLQIFAGKDIHVSGLYAYVAMSSGLGVIDISNSTNPIEVGKFDTDKIIQGVYVDGDYVYSACNGEGLQIFHISDDEDSSISGYSAILLLSAMVGISVILIHKRQKNNR